MFKWQKGSLPLSINAHFQLRVIWQLYKHFENLVVKILPCSVYLHTISTRSEWLNNWITKFIQWYTRSAYLYTSFGVTSSHWEPIFCCFYYLFTMALWLDNDLEVEAHLSLHQTVMGCTHTIRSHHRRRDKPCLVKSCV